MYLELRLGQTIGTGLLDAVHRRTDKPRVEHLLGNVPLPRVMHFVQTRHLGIWLFGSTLDSSQFEIPLEIDIACALAQKLNSGDDSPSDRLLYANVHLSYLTMGISSSLKSNSISPLDIIFRREAVSPDVHSTGHSANPFSSDVDSSRAG
jgi:hypothetical protein